MRDPQIEAQHPQLAARLRRELADILVERVLGREPEEIDNV